MLKRLAGAIFVLLMTSTAAGQRQTVYVFPQQTTVTAARPGLINAMCLDPDVIGAPETTDPITRWQRPEVIVVRRLHDDQVTGTQRWSELGPDSRPWVCFEGASDIVRRVALRARATRPESGITYEVEFVEATAAARPQEVLTASSLARLEEFEGSFGVITEDLNELRAAFPPDALLIRLYETFAQQVLYPAVSRDVPAAELERATQRFLNWVQGLFAIGDGKVRALLAVFLGGSSELTAEQRAFFARHGITWDDVDISTPELTATEQFRQAYAPAVLQACTDLCQGEPRAAAEGLRFAQQGLTRLAAWHQAGLSCDGASVAYALGPAFQVTCRNGQPWLTRQTGLGAFNLSQLLRGVRDMHAVLASDRRCRNLKRQLARLDERLARLNTSTRLPGDFWEQEAAQQAQTLLLLGAELPRVPLEPLLERIVRTGSALPPALRVALREGDWLIDVRELTSRERRTLERQVRELEQLTGIGCTLLTSEGSRQSLAGLPDQDPGTPP